MKLEESSRESLSMEFRNTNYFPQHITDIRDYLVKELKSEESKKDATS